VVPSPDVVQAAADRLSLHLGVVAAASFTGYIRALDAAVRNSPRPANQILSRPDLTEALSYSLRVAHGHTATLIQQAWQHGGGDPESIYRHAALSGAAGALNELRGQIDGIVREELGTPAPDPAHRIQQAVSDAVTKVVTRMRMSLESAAGASHTEAVIAEGRQLQQQGQHVMKVWRSRLSRRTCRWCRELDGVMIPLDDDFPHGDPVALEQSRTRRVATPAGVRRYRRSMGQPIILTHPPRVWLGRLPGPKRHPRCECWLELHILTEAGPPPAPLRSEEPAERMYVRASDIAELPEPQYMGLMAFLRAATHELGQVLRRLKGL
jgi:hypothetical protein